MSEGFVMAMVGQSTFWTPVRQRRVLQSHFIVSRSGPGGRLLLIGCVGRAARFEQAAIVPRFTLAGSLVERRGPPGGALRFALLAAVPSDVVVAGRLCPATGLALLSAPPPATGLRVNARLAGDLRCCVTMYRAAWIGEVLTDSEET